MSLALVCLGAFLMGSVFGAILQVKTHWITKAEGSEVERLTAEIETLRAKVFDNSRWGALNTKQRMVVATFDVWSSMLTDWDRHVLARIAVTYAHDEVLAALNDGDPRD